MNLQQQIAAIQSALAAIQAQITQTSNALMNASTPEDVTSLTSTLASLHAQEAQLQAMLVNLQAAAAGVQPMGIGASMPAPPAITNRGANAIRRLASELEASITDREVTRVTLKRATRVADSVTAMHLLLSGQDPSAVRGKPALSKNTKALKRRAPDARRTLTLTGDNTTDVPPRKGKSVRKTQF